MSERPDVWKVSSAREIADCRVFKVREENYPHIRFVITKGLGHRRIYRENKVSREVIDFM